MYKLLLCGTEKIWEILLESALPMVLEYLVAELVKESIKQAKIQQKNKYEPTITVNNQLTTIN